MSVHRRGWFYVFSHPNTWDTSWRVEVGAGLTAVYAKIALGAWRTFGVGVYRAGWRS